MSLTRGPPSLTHKQLLHVGALPRGRGPLGLRAGHSGSGRVTAAGASAEAECANSSSQGTKPTSQMLPL